jgi:L-aminopeptidase/D-esterase-like protein
VAALAVANAFGDVLAGDGSVLGGAGPGDIRSGDAIGALDRVPAPGELEERNTTLVCVMTDAALDKSGCARVARAASAGTARAVEPVFTDVDGDVVFCLASGEGPAAERFLTLQVATLAARVTAEAIRDAVRSAG